MPLWTMTDQADDAGKPKSLKQASKDTVDTNDAAQLSSVYGITTGEMSTGADGAKVTHPGWVKRRVGSGGRSSRVHYETLVAASTITGTDSADDTEFADS